jgi:hypothetical protein
MRDLGNGGSIILASSASGLRATPGLTAYSMARFPSEGYVSLQQQSWENMGLELTQSIPAESIHLCFWRPGPRNREKLC